MKSNDVEYEHRKKRAYDREDWRHGHWRPGVTCLKRQSTQEEVGLLFQEFSSIL